jgi:hypothetical protein
MCDPMTLAVTTFMVGAAQAGGSYISSSQKASAQNAMYDANKANAERSASYEYNQNQIRKQQEEAAAGDKGFQNMLDTRAKVATTETAAGDVGITGLSVESLVRDIYGAGGRTNDNIKSNLDMTQSQLSAEDNGIFARENDRINSVQHGIQPSLFGLGLDIAASGLSAATGYKKMTK